MIKVSAIVYSLAAFTVAFSGSANATISLTNEYAITSFASGVGANEWQFDYTVTNNNQGLGGFTGLDGFTIYIPQAATIVASTSPVSYNGFPGFWTMQVGTGLELLGNGSASLIPPTGFKSLTWWGNDPHSVYTPGSTAAFSVTLGNVSVGNGTVGMTTYFGSGTPSQQYAQNQWGNYSTITTNATAPVTAVPEPESYAMLLAGLGLLGAIARRRNQKA